MFNLERRERFIIIFLISALLLGSGLAIYRKAHPPVRLEIKNFIAEEILDYGKELVNINEADADELMRLRGVGKILAGRIIDYRIQKGPFRLPSDIKNVSGIGESLFEKIKNDISVE